MSRSVPKSSRRGLRLASALVAAGLALSFAPPALADDSGSDLLVLTDGQAETLESHAQVDPYAAADGKSVTPDGAGREDTAASGSGSRLDEDTGTDAGTVSVNAKSNLEGVRGIAATSPVGGTSGDYFTLHSLGTVARSAPDGKQLWRRDNASLYADWKVTPTRPWQTERYPARIAMGYNAVSPFSPMSDQGYATGDLTGDGMDDVVFSASVGISPYRPFTSPGSSLANGTFVTVLDGKTGKTLWTKLYAYAFSVKLVGKTLLIGDSPYYNLNSDKAATATLTGIRFSYADGALAPASTWTYDAGVRDRTTWGALEDVGDGLVAASWSKRKTTATAGAARTLLLDTKDGSVKWQTDSSLYTRQLHLDASRGRLVALEQADPTDGVKYELASYAVSDGERSTLDTRVNALPLDVELGDLKGDRKPEYVVSESTLDENFYLNANTVRAVDGSDGSTELWSRTVKRDPANSHDSGGAWGLSVLDHKVVASYLDDASNDSAENRGASRLARLAVLDGSDGAVRWEQRGALASPLYAQPFKDGDGWHLRTVDEDQNLRTYGFGSGKQQRLLPLQGDIAYARSTDVNGDGKKDLVVGGQSRGVWAYDGPSLVAGKPKLLWKATLPGQIHGIENADTDGDGRKDELVIAADTAAAVLDAHTGRDLATIDGAGQYVHSATPADLDGDGRDEVVVPTDKVRAYRASGKTLWTYAAPAGSGDVVFGDVAVREGRVYAQYNSVNSFALDAPVVNGVALKAKDGSTLWTADPKMPADTDGKVRATVLVNGVFSAREILYADGHAVVYTWITEDDITPRTVVDIRDSRTGKPLSVTAAGGLYTLGDFFTGPEGLVLAGTASLRTYANDGSDYEIFTLPTLQNAGFVTGPGGRRLIAGGVEGGVYLWDPSVLKAAHNYPDHVARMSLMGTRNTFTSDLNGDGVDEIVALNFDVTGYDRSAGLIGGGYYLPDTAIHQVTVATIDAS
ncbi:MULTISPECIES: FG-GAP-like repeat-containing protein [unclassified Streptomyces]|uniref:VCBS repeat-containing protein n=1 Tax=Streptomyces sp. NBC_00119 TaxID=2975659 RepID=A0AAU1UEM8_9ACTN|nr:MULTISPECIES: FG-GAP-like repeat-containing protein [unclassified Streptomyces]MCX4646441.1 VCBS repeat-containing protein [Streptomyces sp. NBC_01446]MCX5319065.1 VCBS repeat-containing protein [Streptomyces sp. NBC_00120]